MFSHIFAKVLGLYFLAIGLAFLINPNRFRNIYQDTVRDQNFLLLGAIIALILGAFIISIHNKWIWGWQVIITILGWWSFIKGFGLLVYPEALQYFKFMENRSNTFYRSISLFYIIVG